MIITFGAETKKRNGVEQKTSWDRNINEEITDTDRYTLQTEGELS